MKKIVVANWKMHGDLAMAHPLTLAIADKADQLPDAVEVILCPPAIFIPQMQNWLIGSVVKMGGQDCHVQAEGAFTGDISAKMLANAGCRYVIVGHSERRQFHHETNEDIRAKAEQAMRNGLIPIICVGESEEDFMRGKSIQVVGGQVAECLPSTASTGNFMLAYEPLWAIGSGKIPSPSDIRDMHMAIASVAAKQSGLAPERITVLYGGSVKASNAEEIMTIEGVAGVLVGGASLKVEEFCHIMAAA